MILTIQKQSISNISGNKLGTASLAGKQITAPKKVLTASKKNGLVTMHHQPVCES